MEIQRESAPCSAAVEDRAPVMVRDATKRSSFRDAVRLQQSFTASAERKALAWLAARVPSWVNSDHLTLLGLAAMLGAGGGYVLAHWTRTGLIIATVCLAINWFGDSLDGTLARVRNRQRPRYGFYVDHMIDTIGGLFLMSGLAASRYLDWRVAVGMLIAYEMLSIEVYLAAYTIGTFRLSFAKLGPTEIRILLAAGNVVLWLHPNAHAFGAYRLFDVGGCIAIVAMFVMLIAATAHNTKKLYREETLR
jgi:archaetidylinositol phosphate synthase